MWYSSREIARLESALEDALRRAETAESRLAEERKRLDDIVASERQSKDWFALQITSRLVTKNGGYGLDHEPRTPVATTPHPKGFIREPTEIDEAKLEFYKKCARDAGAPEEDAVQKWEAEMRGEMPTYEMESEQ